MIVILSTLIHTALALIFLAASGYIGLSFIQIVDYKNKRLHEYSTQLGLIVGFTLFPLSIYLFHYFTTILIRPILVYSLTVFLVITLSVLRRVFKLEALKISVSWILIFIVGFLIIFAIRIRDQRMIGPDIYIYLERSSQIFADGYSKYPFDRQIVDVLPAIISLFSGLSTQISLKILGALIFGITGLAIGSLTQFFTNKKWGVFASLLVYLNTAHLRMSLDILAMQLGLAILLTIVLLILLSLKRKSTEWSLLTVVLTGALFNIHGLVAFASFALIVPPLIVTLLFLYRQQGLFKKIPLIILSIFLFFISAQPLIITGMNRFSNLLLKPAIKKISIEKSTIDTPEKVKNVAIEASSSSEQKGLSQQQTSARPLGLINSDTFLDYYSPIFLFLAVIGILITIYKVRWVKENRAERIVFLYFCFVLYLLTQQAYFGFDWYSTRFVIGLYLIIVPLNVITLSYIYQINSSIKYHFLLSLLLVFLGLYSSLTIYKNLDKNFAPSPSIELYDFFVKVDDYVDEDTPIITILSSTRMEALNPYHNFVRVPYKSICSQVNKNNPDLLEYKFSQYVDATQSAQLLWDIYDDHYLAVDVLIDCFNQEVLTKESYDLILSTKNFRLLKAKPPQKPQ